MTYVPLNHWNLFTFGSLILILGYKPLNTNRLRLSYEDLWDSGIFQAKNDEKLQMISQNLRKNLQIRDRFLKISLLSFFALSSTTSTNCCWKCFVCLWADSIPKTRKSNEEQQKATNGKWKHPQKTKTSNEKQQRATFFFFHISTHLLQLWTYGRWLT